jgi:hypothetical protein
VPYVIDRADLVDGYRSRPHAPAAEAQPFRLPLVKRRSIKKKGRSDSCCGET